MQRNWDHIRFFLALAEHGTLSLSARTLGVSHSTVLRRIRQLEVDLNAQLFDQTNAGYSLTSAGKTLLEEAVKMRSTMTALSREIAGADNQMQGDIVITTTDTLAKHVLPKLIAPLTQQHDGIRFTLNMANSLSDMDTRDADIAIRTCKQPPENLIGRKVAEIKFIAVASKQYAEQYGITEFPTDLAGHRFISLDESYSSSPFHQWLSSRIQHIDSITTANNFLCAAAMAGEGMGITLVPSYVLSANENLVKLKTDAEISSNDLWILSHKDSRNTEKIRVVRQYFYKELPKQLI